MTLYDENASILRDIAFSGVDLAKPRPIDFATIFPDQTSAEAFAQQARVQGFDVSVEKVSDRDDQPWDAIATKTMMPTCENITDTEEELEALSKKLGGSSDGWGFF